MCRKLILGFVAVIFIAGKANGFTLSKPSDRYHLTHQDVLSFSPALGTRSIDHIYSKRRPTSHVTALHSTLMETITQLKNPISAFTNLSSNVQSTPAIAYFLVLVLAGFGVPVSEDLLCIFAGTMLPISKIQSPARRIRLIVALYLGVVVSDIITFSIGRMTKVGLLEPLRKRMNLGQDERTENEGAAATAAVVENNGQEKSRKRDRVLQKLESAGDMAGFYARMSVGFRPAMMILAGFSGKVSYPKYILGTAVGGIFSLTAQLLLGYSMHRKPSDIIALSSKLMVFTPAVLISALVVYLVRQKTSTKPASQSNA